MSNLTPHSAARELTTSVAALCFHSPFVAQIERLMPLIYNPRIVPVAYEPSDERAIAHAFDMEARLPSLAELDGIRLRVEDALEGPAAGPDAMSAMIGALFASRPNGGGESAFARIGYMHAAVQHLKLSLNLTADILAHATMQDLLSNRFAPTPAEFAAAIRKGREQIAAVGDALPDLIEVRASADDLLVAAGKREPADDDDGLGWPP